MAGWLSQADGVCQIADGPGLAAETARRIACDAATVTIKERPAGIILDGLLHADGLLDPRPAR